MAWYDFIAVYRKRFPVTFKSLKEEKAVFSVALWADKELKLKQGESKLGFSLMLPTWIYSLNRGGRIPLEELAVLSPFIDLTIDGKKPHRTPQVGYEYSQQEMLEQQIETLRRFKTRMQAEGLWPQPQS
jgi:hypothetical protein